MNSLAPAIILYPLPSLLRRFVSFFQVTPTNSVKVLPSRCLQKGEEKKKTIEYFYKQIIQFSILEVPTAVLNAEIIYPKKFNNFKIPPKKLNQNKLHVRQLKHQYLPATPRSLLPSNFLSYRSCLSCKHLASYDPQTLRHRLHFLYDYDDLCHQQGHQSRNDGLGHQEGGPCDHPSYPSNTSFLHNWFYDLHYT